MPIKDAKIYNDGSHFIAIPPDNFKSGKHKKQLSKKQQHKTPKSKRLKRRIKKAKAYPSASVKSILPRNCKANLKTPSKQRNIPSKT